MSTFEIPLRANNLIDSIAYRLRLSIENKGYYSKKWKRIRLNFRINLLSPFYANYKEWPHGVVTLNLEKEWKIVYCRLGFAICTDNMALLVDKTLRPKFCVKQGMVDYKSIAIVLLILVAGKNNPDLFKGGLTLDQILPEIIRVPT